MRSSERRNAERLERLLSAAADLGAYSQLTLFADQYEDGVAESALRRWAQNNSLELEDHSSGDSDANFRALYVSGCDGPYIALLWRKASSPD